MLQSLSSYPFPPKVDGFKTQKDLDLSSHISIAVMPAQQLAQPNPPPERSQLPESLLSLGIGLNTDESLSKDELHAIKCFRRAACYISAGVFFCLFLCLSTLTGHSNVVHQKQYLTRKGVDEEGRQASHFRTLGHRSRSYSMLCSRQSSCKKA